METRGDSVINACFKAKSVSVVEATLRSRPKRCQFSQFRFRFAVGQNLRGQLPALSNRFGFPRDEQRRAGVEKHSVAFGAVVFVAQYAVDNFCVGLAVTTSKVREHGRLYRKMCGRNNRAGEPALLVKFRDGIFAERGKFIKPGIAHASADDHAALNAERLQDVRERGAKFGARDADKLRGRPRGIEERAEEVEDGAPAALRAKFARGANVTERRVKVRREKESEMMLAQRTRGRFGRQLDFDAEGFQDVRTPGLRSDGAVAMLGDCHLSRGADNGHGGGDVESVEAVAARAANVENNTGTGFGIERRDDGFGAEFAGERGDFVGSLIFEGETAEKIGLKLDGDRFVNELVDGGGDLFAAEMDALRELLIK